MLGPQSENVMLGYRLPGKATRDGLRLRMLDKILTNGQAGLIRPRPEPAAESAAGRIVHRPQRRLLHARAVRHAAPGPEAGRRCRALLLGELAKVKRGDFPDWLIPAIVNNDKLEPHQGLRKQRGPRLRPCTSRLLSA
ncbi:MAG: hypothetical protein WKG07_42445 [Hymenobacter sp.]